MKKILFLLMLIWGSANAQKISTAKPWTYWWWMGSAVSEADIRYQLLTFQKSGLGGVHIIPIYGAKGHENEFRKFLSPEWLKLLDYTIVEGRRLGLGVDMTTGTGWPFGGPNVSVDMGAKSMQIKNEKFLIENTNQKVKRAAPGGEGLVFDPFGKDIMNEYLTRFDSAFSHASHLPRAMYMDSYEAYGANWTVDFLPEFKRRRGYDLSAKSPFLTDSSGNKDAELVRIDYHQTLSELLLERYARSWTSWSTAKHFLTRYQAHGSPGNLLDLYDQADIPETESFGTSRFDIPGLRVDPDYSIQQFGTPNVLAMKFASSAAHISSKPLVSSETGTWLANHFKVSLSQVKPQIDELFTAGINHIFYHGTTYSPEKAPYPGWLFYASTNFGPQSHFAEQFPLLNRYVEKCQEILQSTKPDNDILVYFPIQDLWATPGKSAGGIHLLEVHHVDRWLLDLPFGKLSQKLLADGYSFDYVSDRQLEGIKVDEKGNLKTKGGSYKTMVIPASTYISENTINLIIELAKKGGKIIFDGKTPDILTGYNNREQNAAAYSRIREEIVKIPSIKISGDINISLAENGIVGEDIANKGLSFIRKTDSRGHAIYFVSNLGNKFKEGWVTLNKLDYVEKYNPLYGRENLPFRKRNNISEVYLKLEPGQSCFLSYISGNGNITNGSEFENEYPISGIWRIEFLKGMPRVPKPTNMKNLVSWTTLPDSAEYFSGKAKYSIRFDFSALSNAKEIYLDLGDVRESAQVYINKKLVGTTWSIPFKLPIPIGNLKNKDNELEIVVTNLSANYMRLRDRQAPEWKIFYDINIVDITYKKFEAAQWTPIPSGLLGPVRLLYR